MSTKILNNKNEIIGFNINIKTNDSSKWLKIAHDEALKLCEKNNIKFIEAEIFVRLPEKGRCLTKKRGFINFNSHG